MKKRDAYARKLTGLLDDPEKMEAFLVDNSALPGRRANIELAAAFADLFEGGAEGEGWKRLVEWASPSPDEAPTNSEREFLPFCAVQALGAAYPASGKTRRSEILGLLRAASGGPRWRTREAAAFALQRIGERDFTELRRIVQERLDRASLTELRAIIATLAHPPTLRDGGAAGFALEVGDRIMGVVCGLPAAERGTEDFRVLAKALGYGLSVFTAASPEAGFSLLRRWASVEDAEIRKIVAASIRKARLARKFPEECREVAQALSWAE